MADSKPVIARNLRRFIARAGITHRQLETRSGVSRQQIHRILTCEAAPTSDTIDKLAATLGESSGAFFIDVPEESPAVSA